MATTNASLRYVAHRLINDDLPGETVRIESNLEKAARAMRYAMKTVQYYSPNYDYELVVKRNNEDAKKLFR